MIEESKEKICACDCDCQCEQQKEEVKAKKRSDCRCSCEIDEEELQEIYHNATLGKVSIEIVRPMSKDRTFRDMLSRQYDGYDSISKRMEEYAALRGVALKDPTGFARGMMYCTTMVNTMTDKSSSKLSEILIQGINMGIISLTKISNKLGNERKSNEFVDAMSDLLQEYLSETKAFL